jgi:hypothetical protein
MYYLALEFYRHWIAMSPQSHTSAIIYLSFYPLPWLLLMKGKTNPFLLAVLFYLSSGVATFLIFPTTF